MIVGVLVQIDCSDFVMESEINELPALSGATSTSDASVKSLEKYGSAAPLPEFSQSPSNPRPPFVLPEALMASATHLVSYLEAQEEQEGREVHGRDQDMIAC